MWKKKWTCLQARTSIRTRSEGQKWNIFFMLRWERSKTRSENYVWTRVSAQKLRSSKWNNFFLLPLPFIHLFVRFIFLSYFFSNIYTNTHIRVRVSALCCEVFFIFSFSHCTNALDAESMMRAVGAVLHFSWTSIEPVLEIDFHFTIRITIMSAIK